MDHAPDLVDGAQRARIGEILWKRAFDLAVASAAIVLTSPLLLGAALAIKVTSPGPALYVQPRRGKDGRVFDVFKLRTLRHENCDAPDQREVVAVASHDARVFPVGEFLRRHGLDEIPQLWNVLRGDMSIVGPRPHALPHDDLYLASVPRYAHRYAVKPGITGWAQVNGSRGRINTLDDAIERLRLDRDYIQRMSLWLDIVVTMRTFGLLLHGMEPKRKAHD